MSKDNLWTSIRPAGNEKGSLTILDYKEYLANRPESARYVAEEMRLASTIPGSKLTMLDLGCGAGEVVATMAHELQALGKEVEVVAVDLVEKNVVDTRSLFSARGITGKVEQMDLRANFPLGKFDYIEMRDLIHWLSPDEAENLIRLSSNAMSKEGLLSVGGCTQFNNAVVKNEEGVIDMSRSNGDLPLWIYSHACKCTMSAWDQRTLKSLGEKCGLECVYSLGIPNLHLPVLSQLESEARALYPAGATENIGMIFKKTN